MIVIFRVLLPLILILPSAAKVYAAQGEACVRVFKASKSLSQKVRDNTPHFWRFVRQKQNQYFYILRGQMGLVAGDAHPGNFIYSRLNGSMRLFFVDIKDSGRAPMIYDLARMVASTHAILRGEAGLYSTAQRMLEAYQSGLRGARVNAPVNVRARLNATLRDYSELELDYVQKATRKNRFKIKAGKRERIPFQSTDRDRFEKLEVDITRFVRETYPNAQLLDLAIRPRERGGSQGLTRYWALIEARGVKRIVEFKQIGVPATAAYGTQDSHEKRYEEVMNAFWPARDNAFGVVELDGGEFFMRPRKADVFRIPYKLKSQDDIEFTKDLAVYEAYLIGKMHSAQLNSMAYKNALADNLNETIEDLVKFTRDYLTVLELEVDEASESDEESEE